MTTAAIIVAAGRGTRAGGDLPKQYQSVAGRPVLTHTLHRFAQHPVIDQIVVVLHPEDGQLWTSLPKPDVALQVCHGGADRAASVRAGLDMVHCDRVLIHDAARATVPRKVIDDVITALDRGPAAAPGLAVTDALWRGDDAHVTGTQDRTGLFRAQTPQGFHTQALRDAHAAHPGGAADDVAVARAYGLTVTIVPGHEDNIKITTPGDFARAARLMKGGPMDIRTGNGYDVHKFGPGDRVILCGVPIPHTHGLVGHSDADVAMHTVTDAIYGALAAGDIGQHFPPSDPQWKGAASDIFLRHAVDLALSQGFQITHVDCTLVCEFPKIGPHAPTMRAKMAEIMGMGVDRVSVKATTSEKLGFTGRGEGIACLATTTLLKP